MAAPILSTARKTQLKRFLGGVLSGKKLVDSLHSGTLLLESICCEPDPTICIEKLAASTAALESLHRSLRYDVSPEFINKHITQFLQYIAHPSIKALCSGQLLHTVLKVVTEPPTFWHALLQAQKTQCLTDDATRWLGWLLLELLISPAVGPDDKRTTAESFTHERTFLGAKLFETRSFGEKIKDVLQVTAVSTGYNSLYKPGGRHDNDFADFRGIAILPTADELQSREKSFYRLATAVCEEEDEARPAIHLDNQFRLLREDMLAELRTDLQVALGQRKGKRRNVVLRDLALAGLYCGSTQKVKRDGEPCALALYCLNGIPQLHGRSKLETRDYLKANPRFIKHNSFGCLLHENQIVAFGNIDRDESLLSADPPVLVIEIPDGPAVGKALLAAKDGRNLRFIQVDTPIFSYQPILNCLQGMTALPLAGDLLQYNDTSSSQDVPPYLEDIKMRMLDNEELGLQSILDTPRDIILDDSQQLSFDAGLSKRVSLIQGPPGTGKSFIGALLAKAIFKHSNETIQVICYTNHALDQFLEDLLDIGIPAKSIIRLGSKSTAKTKCLTVREQSGGSKLNQAKWSVIDHLRQEADNIESDMHRIVERFRDRAGDRSDILNFLEFSDSEYPFHESFVLPQRVNGMTVVDRNGKPISKFYLLDQWVKGSSAGVFKNLIPKSCVDVWSMDLETRMVHFNSWKEAILRDQVDGIQELMLNYNKRQASLKKLLNERDVSLIKSKRVIGCTTTAAAMYTEALQAASPGVLIVEEAGEILECHTLAALTPNTKQLILIGDHKQLRPKTNNYGLTIQKGDGYNLNVSLFERLISAGVPHTTLLKQHRMSPEISALIRNLTYPDLVDAPGTANRPPLRGFQDRLVFFNHNHPELEASQVAEKRDPDLALSKQNLFEVEMVLKCVRYLGQQGYGTDKLVILTPYLGQLHLLLNSLRSSNDPVLNDLDSFDLVQAGLLPAASAAIARPQIRLSTIDNYQGEESDIVIVSLTRSNAIGQIGFMAEPERVNVLLSRARDALILIGNASTFMQTRKGSQVWTPLLNILKAGGHIYDGLPVKCERHPESRNLIQNEKEFDIHCPDGGCVEPCGAILKCGAHKCPRKCHQLVDHSKMKCQHWIKDTCPIGHKLSWQCFQSRISICRRCEDERRKREERERINNLLESDREAKQRAYALELFKLQDEIADERRILRDARDQETREEVLAQQRKELADLRSRQVVKAQQGLTENSPVNMTNQSEKGSPAPGPTKTTGSKDLASSQDKSSNAPSYLEGTDTSRHSDNSPTTPNLHSPTNMVPESPAKEDWEYQKAFENASLESLDKLMSMTGLEEVKQQFLTIKSKVDTVVRQNTNLKDERFGAAFLGNPGTGKTTVARLYADFLSSVGVLPGNHFFETSGSRLASEGVDGAKKHIQTILEEGGGAFFIDEAYQLVSSNSFGGSQVLDFLLAEIENLTGKIVFIIAGYNKQMEAFYAHNPGIPSRIPYQLQFKDYKDTELQQILEDRIQQKFKGTMKIEGGLGGLYLRIVARRIGTKRGREGFGNARAVQNTFAHITDRQAKRLRAERKQKKPTDVLQLTKEDLIGPEPATALEHNVAWKKVQTMIGLKVVKESVKALLDSIQSNYQRELDEQPYVQFSLNRVLLGSPGTGKTTVAKLYGQILADIGLLSSGEVITKNPADFVGSVIGQSESNTKAILAATAGKVLIIDEAYMLAGSSNDNGGSTSDPYRTAVVDTLVAEVQSTPGEDRCVLMLGYKDQMESMLQNVNPGLARRFPIASAFVFEDFDNPELQQILSLKLKTQGFRATDQAKHVALDVLDRARNQPHFGNAGEVDILLDRAKMSHQKRVSAGQAKENSLLEAIDFDEEFDRGKRTSTNVKKLFEGVIGCEKIVQKLEGYQKITANLKALGDDPKDGISFNFLFRGPPGTGKTTTARKMGKVFYDMGFLSTAEVVETSATDLIGQYVGQTGPKTQKLLEKALGKVLFIDEAYRLAEGGFSTEAMDELVDCLTKPKYHKKLVTILAGYDNDINRLMAMNPGLTSRFPEAIVFESLGSRQCVEFLRSTLLRKSKLDERFTANAVDGISADLTDAFETLAKLSSWGNARDLQTLATSIYGSLLKDSTITKKSPKLMLRPEHIMAAVQSMVDERINRANASTSRRLHSGGLEDTTQTLQLQNPAQNGPGMSAQTREGAEQPRELNADELPCANNSPQHQRDAGVADAIWQQLQCDKFVAEELEKQRQKLTDAEKKLRASLQAEDAKAEVELQSLLREVKEKSEDNEMRRRYEQKRIQEELARRERAAKQAEWEAKAAIAREEKRKEEEAQRKLRDIGVCPVGYRWIKQEGGYRCAGGSHFVSDAALLLMVDSRTRRQH
ncbi:P-loop containing nucleoside triphosphate hydrolase protein [Microthyrium microscopicum]|uniref:P-loop containing nucleoside triphosphate hydrolase protein n=1 Tax=Microthyrium microscopicum TaxID=703497 RepID=A0A6A6UBT5_9PEZI|nr:P-loop containing nucleoside triphosphate hydrolase protein [Microthyrium microscopicum]